MELFNELLPIRRPQDSQPTPAERQNTQRLLIMHGLVEKINTLSPPCFTVQLEAEKEVLDLLERWYSQKQKVFCRKLESEEEAPNKISQTNFGGNIITENWTFH